ncbi:Uu.00g057240.m01.CDS01 [Anthostomella pinea]|uniref:Uu.00g057240.m01.CDS01 n=1 Tax=Anthostomella pinea TaxID=933095 RepID=A0AAI8VSF9_9PEZI|nr:Uu.00g057240.m01.CDS01 [Anthostomella pinea]
MKFSSAALVLLGGVSSDWHATSQRLYHALAFAQAQEGPYSRARKKTCAMAFDDNSDLILPAAESTISNTALSVRSAHSAGGGSGMVSREDAETITISKNHAARLIDISPQVNFDAAFIGGTDCALGVFFLSNFTGFLSAGSTELQVFSPNTGGADALIGIPFNITLDDKSHCLVKFDCELHRKGSLNFTISIRSDDDPGAVVITHSLETPGINSFFIAELVNMDVPCAD